MKSIKHNDIIYKYRITMGDIEAYLSLKNKEPGDWQRILGLPADCDVHYPQNIGSIDEYKKMCAMSGMMDHYYEMEPEDIIAAYNGHNQIMCDIGNLIILGIYKAFINPEPFTYNQQYTREETINMFQEELKDGFL